MDKTEFTVTKEIGGRYVGIVVDLTRPYPSEVRQNICRYLSAHSLVQKVPDDALITAVKRLTPREQLVLQLRFQSGPLTLRAIGVSLPKLRDGGNREGHWCKGELGISKERVRAIEAKALRKLRRTIALWRPTKDDE